MSDLYRLPVKWHVVETELLVAYGRAKLQHKALQFHTNMDEIAGPVDVAYFSGVLQYLPDWRVPLVHNLIRGAAYIIISRTPLGDEGAAFLQTVVYTDRTIRYPGQVVERQALIDVLQQTHRLASFIHEAVRSEMMSGDEGVGLA